MPKALYIHGEAGVPSYEAVDDRVLLASILGGDPLTLPTAGAGPIGRGHGVLSGSALTVTAGGAQNVSVAAGMAVARGTLTGQFGSYLLRNDAAVTVALTNRHATLPRIDYIIAQVRDAEYAGGSNDWLITKVDGTPAASPVPPAVPESSIVLARVDIPAGSATYTVLAGWITDLRPYARAVGGVTPLLGSTPTTFPNPQDYDFAFTATTQILYMYSAGSWIQVGQNLNAAWTAFVPDFNGTVNLGTGTSYGRFVRMGRTVLGIVGFNLGTGGSLSGNLVLDVTGSGLPAAENISTEFGTGMTYLCGAKGFDFSASLHYGSTAHLDGSTQLLGAFATAGLPSWAAAQPFTWAVNDNLHAFFTYQSDT